MQIGDKKAMRPGTTVLSDLPYLDSYRRFTCFDRLYVPMLLYCFQRR